MRVSNAMLAIVVLAWLGALPANAAWDGVGQQAETTQSAPQTVTEQQIRDGVAWFNRMQQALRNENFNASMVQVQGQRVELFSWLHGRTEEGTELELLYSLNGPDSYLVRQNQQVSYFHPMISPYSMQSRALFGPIPSAFYESYAEIEPSYSAVAMGGGRVLDRPAKHVRLIPRDQQRFSYSLWLDRASGMLLRLATVSPNGDILELVQLTSLEITPEVAADLMQMHNSPMPPLIKDPNVDTRIEHDWQQTWLPEGFHQVRSNHHSLPMTGIAADYFLYSDGLTRVSVYVSQDPRAATSIQYEGLESLYTHRHRDFSVTVVGRLPMETLQRIAASVTR